MNCRIMFRLCFLTIITLPFSVSAQQATVTTGGEAEGPSGSVSYSLGQVSDQFTTDNDGILSEGVQQPHELFIITDLDNPSLLISAKVYPNPTMEELMVEIQEGVTSGLYLEIYNSEGISVQRQKMEATVHRIHLQGYAAGIYYLYILDGHIPLKLFKIVKTH